MNRADIHALVGAYVLDAVDDLERAAFDRHLTDCDSCATEVSELREAASRLADPTWSAPPPGMRAEVLARISRTRQAGPALARRARDPAAVVSRRRRFAAGAAAASLLAAGAAVGTWAVQEQRVRSERAAVAAAQAETARIQAILAAPDAQTRTVGMTGGGRVTMTMSPSHNAGVMTVSSAAAPAPGRAFQLWLIKGGTAARSTVLPAGQAASTVVVQGLLGNDRIGITEEPAGGSATPTPPTVAVLSLT
jgi:Anti-sigma-K factor rskA/Putative zinc-finger